MDRDVIPLLRCPETGSELQLEVSEDRESRVLEGALVSVGSGRRYPIHEGIAELMPPSRAEAPTFLNSRGWEARAEEMEHRLFERLATPFEISAFRNALELSGQDWLIEVGCGRGRLSTQCAKIPHRAVCVDPGLHNIRVCRQRVEGRGFNNATFIQADPTRLPFADNAFDKLFSAQLLAYLTAPEHRAAAIKEMARVCKTDSTMAISAYCYGLLAHLRRDKAGRHKGGLGYVRFTREEFRELLHQSMLVGDITGKLRYVWVGAGVPMKEHSVVLT